MSIHIKINKTDKSLYIYIVQQVIIVVINNQPITTIYIYIYIHICIYSVAFTKHTYLLMGSLGQGSESSHVFNYNNRKHNQFYTGFRCQFMAGLYAISKET